MEMLASLRRVVIGSLPRETRVRIALEDLLASMQTAWYRDSLNEALSKEFVDAGIPLGRGLDFFGIINNAVLRRVPAKDPLYDDLFQEIALNLLDRTRSQGVKKQWVQGAKSLYEQGRLDYLGGWLFRAAENYVKDIHNSLLDRQRRETHFDTPNDDKPSTRDIERFMPEEKGDSPEDTISGVDLFETLRDSLNDDRSKRILDIIVDKGVRGFLRGKGIAELARELDTSPAMATYYRDKVFKPDLLRALRRIGDPDMLKRVQQVFASAKEHQRAQLAAELDAIDDALAQYDL